MLKHYNVSILTKGIDLQWNTLRDWVKNLISHLGGLEIEELTMEGREMVSLEDDLGDPRKVRSLERDIWSCGHRLG
jgi:hypothetical protein